MKYFTLTELSKSSTAKAKGITNTPPPNVIENLVALVDNVLDPIREQWGKPIFVNSGYRSPALNTAIGGAKNSAHLYGEAADIGAGTQADNRKLFEMIKAMHVNGKIVFDQLIDESNYAWIHISYRAGGGNRGQVFKLL